MHLGEVYLILRKGDSLLLVIIFIMTSVSYSETLSERVDEEVTVDSYRYSFPERSSLEATCGDNRRHDIIGFRRNMSGWSSRDDSWLNNVFPFARVNDKKKRSEGDDEFTEEEKMELVFLHNLYRSNVTPPAGDMAFMEWDEQLSRTAQDWANTCNFMHGMPPSVSSYPDTVGQNLYRGWTNSGTRALRLWYEEYAFYHFRNRSCDPGKKCGHYTQMMWARSKFLGCGRKICKGRLVLVVCHYSPAGNDVGQQPYTVGKPCSQCKSSDGGLCTDRLCVTTEQCKRNPGLCSPTCLLECHNCGVLDYDTCRCRCQDGWDSLDCSKRCRDEHEKCGKNPGWPSKTSCSMHHYLIGNKLCRKMCGQCKDRNEDIRSNTSCCAGSMCANGYVLDLERRLCSCRLLCPGSECHLSGTQSKGRFPVLPLNEYAYLVILIHFGFRLSLKI